MVRLKLKSGRGRMATGYSFNTTMVRLKPYLWPEEGPRKPRIPADSQASATPPPPDLGPNSVDPQ